MSMEINGVYSDYAASYTNSANGKKAEGEKSYKTVDEYAKALQGRYSYMNTGTTSMQGVPTTVAVSGAFLKKCMKDPQKAAYLEENLAAIPDCVKSLVNYTKTMPGRPVTTYASYFIDDNGNISCASGCTNDPDGRIARENAARKAQEKKAAEEKAAEKRAEKKKAEERAKKKAAEGAGGLVMRAIGTNVQSVTQSIMDAASGKIAALDVRV